MEKELNLKQLLLTKDIKKGLNSDLFSDKSELKAALNKVISFDGDNQIRVDAVVDGKDVSFENTLYKKELYLLESRVFDKKTDSFIGAYLKVVESDGHVLDLNNVWGTTDWNVVK